MPVHVCRWLAITRIVHAPVRRLPHRSSRCVQGLCACTVQSLQQGAHTHVSAIQPAESMFSLHAQATRRLVFLCMQDMPESDLEGPLVVSRQLARNGSRSGAAAKRRAVGAAIV